jgi:hypothetical protein
MIFLGRKLFNKTSSIVLFSCFGLLGIVLVQAAQDYLSKQIALQLEGSSLDIENTAASASPLLDDVSDFYHSQSLGIGFPQFERVEILESESGQSISLWTEADFAEIEDFFEVTPLLIEIRDNPDNLTAQEWLSTAPYLLEGDPEIILVGGQDAIRFDWSGLYFFTSVVVPHPNRQQMILITWDPELDNYEVLFEGLLDSLIFLSEN